MEAFALPPTLLPSKGIAPTRTSIPRCRRRTPSPTSAPTMHSNDAISRRAAVTSLTLLPFTLLLPPVPHRDHLHNPVAAATTTTPATEFPESKTFTKLPCTSPNCRPVEILDLRVGTGREIPPSKSTATTAIRLTLRWTGRLADRYGWPFQRDTDTDITVTLGRDPLIPGFEQGVQGMREGGKRRLLIPAELGYYDERAGPLPADFGDRRRLFATVLNTRRFKRAGDLLIDVQLKKVRQLK